VRHVDLPAKRASIAAFNAANRHKKRGLAVIPTKFGISFTAKFLNQAGALVLVYNDGTVLINHGGTEIGQGLHTKMAQVAAHAFGIPLHMVSVSDTATDKVTNASPTAASASSDLNGAAVMDACNQILARLAPLRKAHPTKTWQELVSMAYFERIGLGATGFYATPNVSYDFVTHTGTPFNYFTTGVAYADVEVDTLTGDATTLSSHIVMDVGVPINPTIDIGQIEGAFVQGMGLFTMEELVWGDSEHPWVRPGQLQTRGPGTYKLPTANDVPLQMHIELWKGGNNSKAIFSSKGVGEPPLFMAASVFFAIKDALQAQRAVQRMDVNNDCVRV
jgi:xanthine dehydrogenase/oxidase